jgi:hypothetical protein
MAGLPSAQEEFYVGKHKPRELRQDASAEPYEPIDTIAATTKAGGLLGFAGLVASAVQNSLARQNVGFMGVFTRTGGTILTFGTSFRGVERQNRADFEQEASAPATPSGIQYHRTCARRTTATAKR